VRSQKGSALFISILMGAVIIAGWGVYMFTRNSSTQSGTPNIYKADIKSAQDTKIKSDFINLRQSLELYRTQKEHYPENLNQLKDEKVINAIPQNPYTNEPYEYTSDGQNYSLTTKLSDGSEFKLEP
jgi:hypothetical protein